MKLKKGDKVQIIKGKDRVKSTKKGEKTGKTNQAKIIEVLKDKNQVIVDGLNLRYKNIRPKRQGEKGQRIQFPAPIAASSVMFVCSKCNAPTRIGYKLLSSDLKGGKKIRICKKCGEAID